MKIFDNLSKKTKVGLIISIVLCVLLLIISAISIVILFSAGRIAAGTRSCLCFVMAIVTIWYATVGYKQPHGNALRFTYFAFSLGLALHAAVDSTKSEHFAAFILMLFAALIIAYISGRLNKVEKNKKLLILVGLILLADAVIHFVMMDTSTVEFIRVVGYLTPMAYLFALGFAYTARYEQHKEAGLEDKQ